MIEVDLGALGLDRGGHLLVKRALARDGQVRVRGTDPALDVHLTAWCRSQGHALRDGLIVRGPAEAGRWAGSDRAGGLDDVVDHPPARWGLAARGALVEAGATERRFDLDDKDVVWADEASRIYAQGAASQWDPATAIDWAAPLEHPDEVEDAVVQVMTYLIENETAALVVPARFLARIHPHFREVVQVLALQVADEARHIEVFTRRALLRRAALGLSTRGGQASLETLLDEPDFALASFLLSVLGEGSFLELLWFLSVHGPDPVTRQVAGLAARDEARHVAFGMAHLRRHATLDPGLHGRLALAVRRRHDALMHTAGSTRRCSTRSCCSAPAASPDAVAAGFARVQELVARMDAKRRTRLEQLGFDAETAADLSALHTRNFMGLEGRWTIVRGLLHRGRGGVFGVGVGDRDAVLRLGGDRVVGVRAAVAAAAREAQAEQHGGGGASRGAPHSGAAVGAGARGIVQDVVSAPGAGDQRHGSSGPQGSRPSGRMKA